MRKGDSIRPMPSVRQSSLIGIFAPIVAASERFSRSRLRSVVTEGLLTIMPALLADGGFLSELAGLITAVAGLIAAAIAWRRFRTEQRRRTEAERREDEEHEQRIKAEKRKTELEEAVVDLETILAQIPELNAITGEPMDDKIMAVIQQLITKAVQPLITRVNDLTGAVNQLRQKVDELTKEDPPPPPGGDFQELRRKLKAAMERRGIPPGSKEVFVWDNGFERIPVIILGRGTANHRVLFPEKRKGKKGDFVEDDTVPVGQLEPLPQG